MRCPKPPVFPSKVVGGNGKGVLVPPPLQLQIEIEQHRKALASLQLSSAIGLEMGVGGAEHAN